MRAKLIVRSPGVSRRVSRYTQSCLASPGNPYCHGNEYFLSYSEERKKKNPKPNTPNTCNYRASAALHEGYIHSRTRHRSTCPYESGRVFVANSLIAYTCIKKEADYRKQVTYENGRSIFSHYIILNYFFPSNLAPLLAAWDLQFFIHISQPFSSARAEAAA